MAPAALEQQGDRVEFHREEVPNGDAFLRGADRQMFMGAEVGQCARNTRQCFSRRWDADRDLAKQQEFQDTGLEDDATANDLPFEPRRQTQELHGTDEGIGRIGRCVTIEANSDWLRRASAEYPRFPSHRTSGIIAAARIIGTT